MKRPVRAVAYVTEQRAIDGFVEVVAQRAAEIVLSSSTRAFRLAVPERRRGRRDLTIQFELIPDGARYRVALQDMHVM